MGKYLLILKGVKYSVWDHVFMIVCVFVCVCVRLFVWVRMKTQALLLLMSL